MPPEPTPPRGKEKTVQPKKGRDETGNYCLPYSFSASSPKCFPTELKMKVTALKATNTQSLCDFPLPLPPLPSAPKGTQGSDRIEGLSPRCSTLGKPPGLRNRKWSPQQGPAPLWVKHPLSQSQGLSIPCGRARLEAACPLWQFLLSWSMGPSMLTKSSALASV